MSMVVVDIGCSNLKSLKNALDFINCDYKVSSCSKVISSASRLILPGVGAFSTAMKRMDELGLEEVIFSSVIHANIPILGICLGMQLLSNSSLENGLHKGLKLLNGNTELMQTESLDHKVPHFGWRGLKIIDDNSLLLKGICPDDQFYFVHSYHYNGDHISSTFSHGIEFAASVEYKNIFGVQFHPEKSRDAGLRILRNFARL